MVREINDETDDSLEGYSEYIIKRSLAGDSLPSRDNGSNNQYFLVKVDEEYALSHPIISYKDEMVYIEHKSETEPARVLTTIFRDGKGEYYMLEVSIPTIEKADLIQSIFYLIILLYAALLITFLFITVWVYRNSMKPLYVLLKWLESNRLGNMVSELKNNTETIEFRRLNEAVLQYAEYGEEIYQQQKQFIANASHELQTPLAICSNRLEMLMDDESLSEYQMGEIAKTLSTIDYATILFAHRDKYDDLKENFVYKQGEVIYSEGTKGANKIGGAQRHLHFECCAGKTTGSGWTPAKDGTWNLVNGKAPQNCYFITDETNVIKTGGLTFKKISSRVGTPVERNEYVDQLEVIAEVLNARDKATTSGKRLGYINKGIYNILNTTTADGYTWFEVEPSVWIAYNEEWEKLYPRKETEEEKLKKQIASLEATNKQLQDNINQLQNANAQLNNEIVSLKNKLKQINELSKV